MLLNAMLFRYSGHNMYIHIYLYMIENWRSHTFICVILYYLLSYTWRACIYIYIYIYIFFTATGEVYYLKNTPYGRWTILPSLLFSDEYICLLGWVDHHWNLTFRYTYFFAVKPSYYCCVCTCIFVCIIYEMFCWSTLVEVTECCLMGQSYYLKQCCLIKALLCVIALTKST